MSAPRSRYYLVLGLALGLWSLGVAAGSLALGYGAAASCAAA